MESWGGGKTSDIYRVILAAKVSVMKRPVTGELTGSSGLDLIGFFLN